MKKLTRLSSPQAAPFLVIWSIILPLTIFLWTSSATAQSINDNESVAILILIDESGGVSGACNGVPESKVFVVDEEEKRYQIARFMLSLLSAYPNSGINVKVGVTQFAGKVNSLPIVSTSKLDVAEYTSYLKPATDMDPCHTNYEALKTSIEALSQEEVDKRILILITDGSLRGDEAAIQYEYQHTQTGDAIRNYLTSPKEPGRQDVDIYVYLLGKGRCYSENDCGLDEREYKFRRDDIGKWIGWDNPEHQPENQLSGTTIRLIRLLDEEHPLQALTDLLKSINENLIPENGHWLLEEQADMTLPGACTYVTILGVSAGGEKGPKECIDIRDDGHKITNLAVSSDDRIPSLIKWDITVHPIQLGCQQHKWTIQNNCSEDGFQIYYWWDWDPEGNDIGLNLDASSVVVMNDAPPVITASVKINHINSDNRWEIVNTGCYTMRFEIAGAINYSEAQLVKSDTVKTEVRVQKEWDCSNSFPFIVTATLIRREEDGIKVMTTTSTYGTLIFMPYLVEESIKYGKGDDNASTVMTIPIRYAPDICKQTPSQTFTITTTRGIDQIHNTKNDDGVCPDPHIKQVISPGTNGNWIQRDRATVETRVDGDTMIYIVKLSSSDSSNMKGYLECGYNAIYIPEPIKAYVPISQPPPVAACGAPLICIPIAAVGLLLIVLLLRAKQ